MMVLQDEWVTEAMTDDRVVVELLVRLKQAQAAAPFKSPAAVVPLRWGIRQPRSRPAPLATASLRCGGPDQRKEGDSSTTRNSPTTPLSWSGGGGSASPSPAADGCEETSRHTNRSPSHARSKGTAATNIRRSRRKKTFAELKEEESLLLKEKLHLKKELATLRATFNEQRARNENLKRIKVDLNLDSTNTLCSTSNEPEKPVSFQTHQKVATSLERIPSAVVTPTGDNHRQSGSHEPSVPVMTQDNFFLLPDLNMVPSEEDSGPETLYGFS